MVTADSGISVKDELLFVKNEVFYLKSVSPVPILFKVYYTHTASLQPYSRTIQLRQTLLQSLGCPFTLLSFFPSSYFCGALLN